MPRLVTFLNKVILFIGRFYHGWKAVTSLILVKIVKCENFILGGKVKKIKKFIAKCSKKHKLLKSLYLQLIWAFFCVKFNLKIGGGDTMRLKINCDFDSKIIPKDFQSKVVSLFKAGITKSSPERYEDLFGGNKHKQYTFSVYLPKPRNKGAEIQLDEANCIINFSTGDAETGVIFYNALISLSGSKVLFGAGNHITVKNIQIVPEKKIIGNRTVLRTLSPLVSRTHDRETFKNWFYSFEDEEFEPTLKRNMLPYLMDAFGEQARYDLEKLKITPISMKKVVVYCHEIHIESSVGIFELEAEAYLQKYLVENGLGTMTGSGFGMIEQL